MHPCLAIPELVTAICSHCSDVDVPILSHQWTKSLISLALTCKIFLEPALDEVWWSPSLVKAFRRLPEDLWEVSSKNQLSFKRPIRHEDLNGEFAFYAKRVRYISLEGRATPRIRMDVYSLLRACPRASPLFPNLRTLDYIMKIGQADISSMLLTYLSPSVVNFYISFCQSASLEEQGIIGHLDEWCPCLISLDLVYFLKKDPEPISKAVSASIIGLNYLVKVTVTGLTGPAMKHVSTLPKLEELSLCDNKGMNVSPDLFDDKPFPALTYISIWGSSADYCMTFLRVLHQSPLGTVELDLAPIKSASTWTDLLSAFLGWSSDCNLRTISLIEIPSSEKRFLDEDELHDDDELPLALGIEQIRQLKHLCHLQNVTFKPRGQLDLDDSLLEEISSAWPYLHSLDLGLPHEILAPITSKVTLGGLVSVALNCPDVHVISVAFDATEVTLEEGSERPAGGYSSDSVSHIDVFDCPIASVDAVASFISSVFPNAKFLQSGRTGSVNEEYNKRWREVEKMLPLLVSIRAQERRSQPLSQADTR